MVAYQHGQYSFIIQTILPFNTSQKYMLFTTQMINPISKVFQHFLSPAFYRHPRSALPLPLLPCLGPASHDHDNPQHLQKNKPQLAHKSYWKFA